MSNAASLPLDRERARRVGVVEDTGEQHGLFTRWFGAFVQRYLHFRYSRGPTPLAVLANEQLDRAALAEGLIRRACIKASVAGAAVSSLATSATVLTAETEGLASFVTVPSMVAGLGAELAARAYLHLALICDLLDLFGVPPDPADPTDLWRLYALAFGAESHEDATGKELVERLSSEPMHHLGASLGATLVGESLARNLVPFLGVAVSTVQSWRSTRALGDTVRRFARSRRALRDTFAYVDQACSTRMSLLIEGLWFIFSADGILSPEETAILSSKLRALPEVEREALLERFTDDEFGWLDRLEQVPESMGPDLYFGLEVAATVDKIVSAPEKRVLRHAAHRLGQPYSGERLDEMVKDFTETGLLDPSLRPRRP